MTSFDKPIYVGKSRRVMYSNRDSECWWLRHERVTRFLGTVFFTFLTAVELHYVQKHTEECYEWTEE